jgi:photosystem II stability/assembly factor-like uncharacterized protein
MKAPLFALLAAVAIAASAADVMERPARESALAGQRLITGLARAGERVVAVGQRGHVLSSDDGGLHWKQAAVPVSSDLTAVQFPDPRTGYAVGHDGVVIATRDAGVTWTKLLDGREANRLVLEQLTRKVEAGGSDTDRKLLDEARRNVELGPDKPLLDVWFANASEGFAVGAYNLILRTTDSGKTWQSWFDRTDNPKLLNLYAIRPVGEALYIAGEGGLLLRLDRGGDRFKAIPTPYKGSFFGVLGTERGVLAFGMRGNAFLSIDEGAHWRTVDTGLAASIVAGALTPDGRIVLVDQSGGVAASRDGGSEFKPVATGLRKPLAAVTVSAAGLVLGGPRGLRVSAWQEK